MPTIEQLITDARDYASSTLGEAQDALTSANRTISSIGYIVPMVDPLNLDDSLEVPRERPLPTLAGAELVLAAEPGPAPALRDLGAIDLSGMPTTDVDSPDILMPDRPAALPSFDIAPPEINTDVEFPVIPDQLVNPLIPEPEIKDRDAPVAPVVQLPGFDTAVPRNTTAAPTDLSGQMEGAYHRVSPVMTAVLESQVDAFIAKVNPRFGEQMAALEARLARFLQGGTALAPSVEAAIYERTRDRTNAEYLRSHEAAWQDAAARGHTLPDGALSSAVRMARQAGSDNLARANAEIAIKQAELEQQNVQFAITTSASLRNTILNAALNYHQSLVTINGQALDYAKSIASLLVESYNTAVRAYQAELDGFRAEVQAYEVRIRGALAAVELYKAEIDALQALTQVDAAKVNVYRARIEVLQTLAQVYRTRVDTVLSKAQLEKLKLDLFGSQVQLYSSQVQAKGMEWGGYRAAIDGEQAKVQLYTAQTQGKSVEVNAWRARIEGQSDAIRAAAISNEAAARQYEAAWRGYTAVAQARGEVARTKLENDRQTLAAFQAETQAKVSYANMAATYYRTKADVKISYSDQKLRAQLAMGDSMRTFQSSIAELALAGSNQYASMAQTAMSGMNTLVSQEAG